MKTKFKNKFFAQEISTTGYFSHLEITASQAIQKLSKNECLAQIRRTDESYIYILKSHTQKDLLELVPFLEISPEVLAYELSLE